jgi:hypothetical protein
LKQRKLQRKFKASKPESGTLETRRFPAVISSVPRSFLGNSRRLSTLSHFHSLRPVPKVTVAEGVNRYDLDYRPKEPPYFSLFDALSKPGGNLFPR